MVDLEAVAHHKGIEIKAESNLLRGRWGEYHHDTRTIYLARRLTGLHWRSTLAHEIGHAHYGHRGTSHRQEQHADMYAAQLLINPAEYRSAISAHESVAAVAHELQVLPRLIRAYAMLRHPSGFRQRFEP